MGGCASRPGQPSIGVDCHRETGSRAGYHVLLIVNGGLYGLAFVPGLRSRPASLSG